MKDALGHGSNPRGGSRYTQLTLAQQHGIPAQHIATPEEYIQAGGKLPSERDYDDLERRNQDYIRGWGPNPTPYGRDAVARLQAEIEDSRARRTKFGSEEKPSAYTQSLRARK